MNRIVSLTGRLLGADACLHYRFDDENDVYVPEAQHGLTGKLIDQFHETTVKLTDSQVASSIYHNRKAVIVDDIQKSSLKTSELLNDLGVKSQIVLPLAGKSRLFGSINVLYYKIHHFTTKEIAIAEGIAAHTAVALDNAELYSKIESHRLELMSLSKRVVEAQEEERRRISRELHDEAAKL